MATETTQATTMPASSVSAAAKDHAAEDRSDGTAETSGSLDASEPQTHKTGEASSSADGTNNENSDNRDKEERRKSVRFSQINIREYGVTLGDHPGTDVGPPVTIEWDHHAEHNVPVDEYEKEFEETQRRRGTELRMPNKVRESMLKDNHSNAEIRQAQRVAGRVRANRNVAVAMRDMEHFEVAWQSAVRKFKRWRKKRSGTAPEPAEAWMEDFKNGGNPDHSESSVSEPCFTYQSEVNVGRSSLKVSAAEQPIRRAQSMPPMK